VSPQPYSSNLTTTHADNVNEVIHAGDINALATHINALEADANAGGPLDLPGHRVSSDHDGRYARLPLPVRTVSGGPYNSTGVTPGNFLVLRIPQNWSTGTVTKIHSYGVSSGAGSYTWNVSKNGTTTLLHTTNITSGSANTWVISTTLTNNSFVGDDSLWLILASVTGTFTQILIQLEIQL
jgi:hypothetical protein